MNWRRLAGVSRPLRKALGSSLGLGLSAGASGLRTLCIVRVPRTFGLKNALRLARSRRLSILSGASTDILERERSLSEESLGAEPERIMSDDKRDTSL